MADVKLFTGNTKEVGIPEPGKESAALLESRLIAQQERLREIPDTSEDYTTVQVGIAHTLLQLERKEECWDVAFEAFQKLVLAHDWETAVETCEILFQTEQDLSLAALGHGVWIAVTFPINPEITVEMLRLIVEETPPDSDGAAVAAATAHYIADLRAEPGTKHENLTFYTGQMLSNVARRHSEVEAQDAFQAWMMRLELDDPEKFLVRLRNVVDVLVQDDWWIDRDALREALPVN